MNPASPRCALYLVCCRFLAFLVPTVPRLSRGLGFNESIDIRHVRDLPSQDLASEVPEV